MTLTPTPDILYIKRILQRQSGHQRFQSIKLDRRREEDLIFRGICLIQKQKL